MCVRVCVCVCMCASEVLRFRCWWSEEELIGVNGGMLGGVGAELFWKWIDLYDSILR